jgi:hypothetical protein
MSVEYEMPSNGSFIMEVNLIDCNLDPALRDGIFDHMKDEKNLLDYLKRVMPNIKVRKIIKNAPRELL